MSKAGRLISFEGGEGSGKTTQINALSDYLKALNYDVIITREPGGTPEAEKIRDLLVQRDGGQWTPLAETMLFFTARHMHVETLIKPALAAGKIVITDRFADSTRAYQSAGHGLDPALLNQIAALSIGDFAPDLTFILDIEPEQGLARAGHRLEADNSAEDRFERLDLDFHRRLRQGYLDIAAAEPGRCRVVDAARPAAKISAELQQLTQDWLNADV